MPRQCSHVAWKRSLQKRLLPPKCSPDATLCVRHLHDKCVLGTTAFGHIVYLIFDLLSSNREETSVRITKGYASCIFVLSRAAAFLFYNLLLTASPFLIQFVSTCIEMYIYETVLRYELQRKWSIYSVHIMPDVHCYTGFKTVYLKFNFSSYVHFWHVKWIGF